MLEFTLNGDGYHKTLEINVDSSIVDCENLVYFNLPANVFVDPYQVYDLYYRIGAPKVFIKSPNRVDLEAPFENSHNTTLWLRIRKEQIPIHVRYHGANDDGIFPVNLSIQPYLTSSCQVPSTSNEWAVEYEQYIQEGSKNSYSFDYPDGMFDISSVSNVKLPLQDLNFNVPCGNIKHQPFVSSVTLLTSILSALLIILVVLNKK
ncbi:hypothetical protein ROZALSC1DRAFT_28398 [Rozella allomycis CSF55]|uniref:Protein PBN1 n=1 Tax=Rozella allomycis (strain CSF55) TaxID=988480 RepID=A0A075AZU8_ROZAC|nr:hypothetical protein O9G_004151 [Rozella allomycis CSF55]RKP20079.1 hypothetical protein ROZALSC1DRAFT_28398 [Rozella allomycis CSF55]|eukprot:EPZ35866.1 hypothetical protein O9G_004151 [Rozella allomycis CSF55]